MLSWCLLLQQARFLLMNSQILKILTDFLSKILSLLQLFSPKQDLQTKIQSLNVLLLIFLQSLMVLFRRISVIVKKIHSPNVLLLFVLVVLFRRISVIVKKIHSPNVLFLIALVVLFRRISVIVKKIHSPNVLFLIVLQLHMVLLRRHSLINKFENTNTFL